MWNRYRPYRRGIRFFPHIVPIVFPLIFPFGLWLSFFVFHIVFNLLGILLLVALVGVELGYLYTTRFCPRCGRMVRNLRVSACPRCGAVLPRHGMTNVARSAPPSGGDGEDRADPPRVPRP